MSRLRLIPLAAGVCLLVASLVGARLLQNPPDGGTAGGGPAGDPKKGKPTASADSLVQPGTVDSETPLVLVTMPDHLPQARVIDVPVRAGQAVKPGDVLVRFDPALIHQKLAEADQGVQVVVRQQAVAAHAVREQDVAIEGANQGVKSAEALRDLALRTKDMVERKLTDADRAQLDARTITQAEFDRKRQQVREKEEFVQADAAVVRAEEEIKGRRIAVKAAEAEKGRLQLLAEVAAAAVAAAKAKADDARFQIGRCVLKADVAGTVERVDAVRGQTVGPQTRTPLLYVVPDGPRLVRVKVVPEFAYRIQDKVGRAVTVQDESNTSLTYPGTVRRIASAFLPARGAGPESILAKPTPELEVTVEVTDPSPAGKPPLLIGQPVRVFFQ